MKLNIIFNYYIISKYYTIIYLISERISVKTDVACRIQAHETVSVKSIRDQSWRTTSLPCIELSEHGTDLKFPLHNFN